MVVNLRHARRSPQRCRKVGAITRRTRVWHRGVEVTARCFHVDGRRKVARCYAIDASRQFVLRKTADGGLDTETLRGVIVHTARPITGWGPAESR
jgi:hypothetical protein